MNRHQFITGIAGTLALPSLVLAQRPRKLPTLGLLYPNPSTTAIAKLLDIFYAPRLKELGWTVDTNLAVEDASAEGREDRLPALAQTLVEKKVDVIWAAGPEAALAAARVTKTIPIAFYGVAFPVERGLVDTLARPGRNVTGLASIAGFERSKSLELLREIAPGATSLGWIGVDTVVRTLDERRLRIPDSLDTAAAKLGFSYRRHPVSRVEDFDAAFADIVESGAQSLGVDFTALTVRESKRIADFAIRYRLPSVFGQAESVAAGGLLSYGANRTAMVVHSFTYVDRILRGERPGELPVELPSRFELAVNMVTAKAIGITIPNSVLMRADRVIE